MLSSVVITTNKRKMLSSKTKVDLRRVVFTTIIPQILVRRTSDETRKPKIKTRVEVVSVGGPHQSCPQHKTVQSTGSMSSSNSYN